MQIPVSEEAIGQENKRKKMLRTAEIASAWDSEERRSLPPSRRRRSASLEGAQCEGQNRENSRR
jgi:hypothetical protein